MFKKSLTILFSILFLLDILYSFRQHYSAPLDGDIAHNVIPIPAYKKVLEDPFAISILLHKKPYAAPNRFFAHWFQEKYFKTVPFLFDHIMSPIDSVYFSCAFIKTLIQVFIILLLSIYITYPNLSVLNILTVSVLISPFFQTDGYNAYMGIIDKSVTYTIFYALSIALLLLFYLPFYKAFINKTENKFKLGTSIFLFLLVFVLAFNGPLTPGIILLVCPIVLCIYFYKNYKNNNSLRLIKRVVVSVKNIPRPYIFYFGLICTLCIYSLYIGTFNTDGLKHTISLIDRFKKIPEGLEKLITQNLGFPILLIIIVINAVLIKTKYYSKQGQQILFFLWVILLFSVLYILLLPFGGYRIYRPDIVRYDTIMPITIGLIFIFGFSTYYLINCISNKIKKLYITGIVICLCAYTYADGTPKINNTCERQAIENIKNSPKEIVEISCNCFVMDWGMIYDYKFSNYNSQLLQYWGVFTSKKLYYQKRIDSLFLNKVEEFKVKIGKSKIWLDNVAKEAKEKNIALDSCIAMNAKWMAEQEMQKMKSDPVYAQLEGLKWAIKKNKKWFNEVTLRAKERNISVDSSIAIEAKWMAGKNYKKTKQDSLFEKINGIKTAIRKDKKWLDYVKQKAKEKNISLDSSIAIEARWTAGERTQFTKSDSYYKQLYEKLKIVEKNDKKMYAYFVKLSKEKKISLDSCMKFEAKHLSENEVNTIIENHLQKRKNFYIVAIKKDKKWLNSLIKDAKEKNIPLDSCITINAKWMAEQELKK